MTTTLRPSETSALVPYGSPLPFNAILKHDVPCTSLVLAADRASAVPIESRCRATTSSAFISAPLINVEAAVRKRATFPHPDRSVKTDLQDFLGHPLRLANYPAPSRTFHFSS